jgi:hypothetical protein
MIGGTGNDKFVIHSAAAHIDPTTVTTFIDNFKTAGTDTLAVGTSAADLTVGAAITYMPVVLPVAEVETITLHFTPYDELFRQYTGLPITLNNLAGNAVNYTMTANDTDSNTVANHVADAINNATDKLVTATVSTTGALIITADNAGTPLVLATVDISYAILNPVVDGFNSFQEMKDFVVSANTGGDANRIATLASYGVPGGQITGVDGYGVTFRKANGDILATRGLNSPAPPTSDISVTTENVAYAPSTGNFIKADSNAANLSTILDNAKTAFADTVAKYYVGSDGSNSYVITAGDTVGHYTDVIQLTGVSLSNVSATDFVA